MRNLGGQPIAEKALLNWLAVVGWMVAIFFLSSQPSSLLPTVVPDYIPHFLEYAILSWLFMRALSHHIRSLKITSLMAVFLTILYAVTDEFHQLFVPTRTGSFRDLAIDSLAAILTVTLVSRTMRPT